jgi:DNA-binding MarR family transcriptional regulator
MGKEKKVSQDRARISYHLSQEMGIPMAEIARHIGIRTSAVTKAIQNREAII